jgi:hypothetical protein
LKPFVDFIDVEFLWLLKLRVQPPLLARLAMLFDKPGLIFNAVVYLLAERAFTLASANAGAMPIKAIKRLQRAANNAVLKTLGVPDIIVMQNFERPFFNLAAVAC